MTIASRRSGGGYRNRLLDVAEDLRRRLMRTGILIIVLSGALFPLAENLLHWFQVRTAAPLAAFGVADAFLALLTIALGAGAAASLPYGTWQVLAAVAKVFPELTRRTRWLFWAAAILLFFAGVWFCIRITLPYGSRFLLGFESDSLRPIICARQFVFFCLAFSLGFGFLFELPLIMALTAWLEVATSFLARRFRRPAIVLITIVAAVVTPTPDLVNLP
jgi:sec-independent protein translocase protein TatC